MNEHKAPDSRVFIVNASKQENTNPLFRLIRGDSHIQKILFRVPKIYSDIDLSGLAWTVKYKNPDEVGDIIPLGTGEIVNDYINQVWELDGQIASVTGVSEFQLEGQNQSEDGNVIVWQSAPRYIEIDNRLEVDPVHDEEELSSLQQLIIYVGTELEGVIAAGTDARAAAEAANAAVDRVEELQDGGWYTPSVNDDGTLSWTPSKPDMESVPSVNIKGEPGKDGIDGQDGKDGGAYIPSVDEAGNLSWTATEDGMQPIPTVNIRGVDGAPGRDGVDGQPGRDGADGQPGRDGVDGQPGRDGVDGQDGEPGKDGGVYVPSVSNDGTLSWTPTDPDMQAVPPVNIKGEPGSDANVTYENVVAALGFTPADEDNLPPSSVTSVNGKTGDVTLTATDVYAATEEQLDELAEEVRKGAYVDLDDDSASVKFPTWEEHEALANSVALKSDLTQLEQTVDGKADRSEIPAVPVKSVSAAGTALTPDADGNVIIPVATASKPGLILGGASLGIYINPNSGQPSVIRAADAIIDAKREAYQPIVPLTVDRAIRAGLISNSQIADADKPAICETIGADGGNAWTKIIDKTYAEAMASPDDFLLPEDIQYKRFVIVLYVPVNYGVTNNAVHASFTTGQIVSCMLSSLNNADAYAYGSIDAVNATITTAIRTNSGATTLNLYGASYNSVLEMMDALVLGGKIYKLVFAGNKPAGTKFAVYAR